MQTGAQTPPAPPAGGSLAFGMTANAARRIAELTKAEGPEIMFRLAVNGGGCSGYQYDFTFDDTIGDDDLVIRRDGATLLVDEVSLGFLAEAELDFVENLMGAAFQVQNPNAKSSCGCGTSFSV
jgi:iron-sulfur cluster insertion protein